MNDFLCTLIGCKYPDKERFAQYCLRCGWHKNDSKPANWIHLFFALEIYFSLGFGLLIMIVQGIAFFMFPYVFFCYSLIVTISIILARVVEFLGHGW